ncbi:MAG: recombinase family protein, partial [Planctomycetaceae bacterium]|nr:recombinase family protein [Planctomycetaceae bacterium]
MIRDYRDEGISGDATEKRTAFRKMMTDCSRGEFNAILAWDIDRFGRFDAIEAGYWIKPMRDAGVRLVTIGQGEIDFDDFAGRIVYSVQAEAKHSFLRDLARNIVRGQLAKASRGEWTSGSRPLGYRVAENARLIPSDAADVALVRTTPVSSPQPSICWLTVVRRSGEKSKSFGVSRCCMGVEDSMSRARQR